MAVILLCFIYLIFIGLGVPDSLFGTAWPAIYPELGLPVSAASCVTLLISCGTVISSLTSARLINRFGTSAVTVVSTGMTALSLLGFSLSGNFLWLCLFAIPLGLGGGAIDAALNNYVALHYTSAQMSFLHCFYGVGVSMSPFLMSLALSDELKWRNGYRTVFFIQAGIALASLVSLPIWKKVEESRPEQGFTPKSLSLLEQLKMPSVRMVCLIFVGSCAVETTCGTWGSTFLVSAKGMAIDSAARMLTLYYIGMTLGRFLSGVLASKLDSWKLIRLGQVLTGTAILILLLPLSSTIAAACLFLIGLGNAPVFPNLIYLTPRHFGREISQSVTGTQMASSYIGIMIMPPLFGLLAQAVGLWLFPFYLLIMFALMIIGTLLLPRCLTGRNQTDN